jgi:6-phosphogluconolactonase
MNQILMFGLQQSHLPENAKVLEMRVVVLPKDEIPLLLSKMIHDIEAQDSNHKMTMAVSGGSLPSLLGKDVNTNVNWHVFLADERLVPEDSDDSNYKLIKENCLSKWSNAIGYPINYNLADPDLIARDYEKRLDQVLSDNPFDVIFLGMGPDGHTCSLFPGHELLLETKKVGFITDSPKPPPERITLTYPVLNQAKNIIFVVTGSAKSQVLKEILDENKEYPAGMIKNSNITWILDKEAGSELKNCKLESFT